MGLEPLEDNVLGTKIQMKSNSLFTLITKHVKLATKQIGIELFT